MSEANFASLNPALLARKGGAKPAMRPQVGPAAATAQGAAKDLEDLGWNDMGPDEAAAENSGADIVSISAATEKAAEETTKAPSPARSQQDEIAARMDSQPAQRKSAKTRKSALGQERRAAFTLRLDADRHLRLRLAATIKGVSAQALVTEALDAHLTDIADLEALASKIEKS